MGSVAFAWTTADELRFMRELERRNLPLARKYCTALLQRHTWDPIVDVATVEAEARRILLSAAAPESHGSNVTFSGVAQR